MKIRHISALLLLLFAFSITGFSQVEDEEVQMFSFGNSRGIGSNVHDFGVIKDVKAEFQIEITNTEKTDLIIGEIIIPGGVGVTVMNRKVMPGKKAVILVTVDPKYMEQGQFQKKLIITTHAVDQKGIKVSTTTVYGLKGQIL
ncbi:MAG: DUF1573 domain-containing protein [Bacteroidales bacterium]|nr:DUF1573 domain-containing protein [Bacteroidales bacterium]MBN2756048.1 DUF1573 domain-containing protein [Bacteroidales bacterium]